jgi:type IV pilus assembly protein PilE
MMQPEERVMHNLEPTAAGCSPRMPLHQQAGVTLLELMAVVMIIGVLGMIAIPSYRQYTQRTHRVEAKTALLRLATNQERFYLQNHTYSNVIDGSNPFPASSTSENGVYAITVATTAGWTLDYTATATPVVGGGTNGVNQTDDTDCQTFSLTSTGQRTATPNLLGRCW